MMTTLYDSLSKYTNGHIVRVGPCVLVFVMASINLLEHDGITTNAGTSYDFLCTCIPQLGAHVNPTRAFCTDHLVVIQLSGHSGNHCGLYRIGSL